MNAPGKTMLKVVSILFIIFASISLIFSIIGLVASAALTAYIPLSAIILVATIILLISSALQLVLGIIGLTRCGDPSKAGYFITTGIILCVLSFVSLILGISGGSFNFFSLISFILPVLYIVGGFMNKNAAVQS